MLIKLDCREIKLLPLLTGLVNPGDTIISESLPLGDIIICSDDGQEKAIIERKSLADLASSIRDGRYKEQSFRLNQCSLHNHQIYYLIEGDTGWHSMDDDSLQARDLIHHTTKAQHQIYIDFLKLYDENLYEKYVNTQEPILDIKKCIKDSKINII